MMSTLVGWWVYDLTKDPFAIGLVGLSEVVPALSLALYSGHVIDISEKRKLLLKGVFGYICAGSVLLFLSTPFCPQPCQQLHHCLLYLRRNILHRHYPVVCRAYIQYSYCNDGSPSIPPERNYLEPGKLAFCIGHGHAMGGFLIALFGHMGTMIVICSLMITAILHIRQVETESAYTTKWPYLGKCEGRIAVCIPDKRAAGRILA
jgi:hypothetical protein